jgi:hypothetical protein
MRRGRSQIIPAGAYQRITVSPGLLADVVASIGVKIDLPLPDLQHAADLAVCRGRATRERRTSNAYGEETVSLHRDSFVAVPMLITQSSAFG